jgi:arginyl-tRNA synthetase
VTDDEVEPLADQVSSVVGDAIGRAFPALAGADPVIRRSERADYQSNAAMALAKQAKTRPDQVAGRIQAALAEGSGIVGAVEMAGPGFLNLTVADVAIWEQVAARLGHTRLGVGVTEAGRRTVIDYSGPNIAKEMHVGHLRTTIIGDALARVLGFLGAEVIRQNHLGDWGTQFGMLIQYLDEHPEAAWHRDQLAEGASTVTVLDELYKASRATFDADSSFAQRARARVVALQAGDEATVERWREIVAESEVAFRQLYDRLGILLTPEDSVGESFYNPMLAATTEELVAKGIAVESDGALVVFTPGFSKPDGDPVPLFVRKSDGGYSYDTTDLAAIRYRLLDLKADRVLYVVDARQAQHFAMVFAAARRAGWLGDGVEVTHVAFGTMLGPNGKPFKTREGGTVKLGDLLDEAVAAARSEVLERHADHDPDSLAAISEAIGIGSVKYADLSTSRVKDYMFDPERMVSFSGNTGAYLQYAHTRPCSILRRAAEAGVVEGPVDVTVALHPTERALALQIDAFGPHLVEVARTLEPHRLAGYLYELARAFTAFYGPEGVRVVDAGEPYRSNRLALCRLTRQTMAAGLDLLGMAAPERM